MSEQPQVKDGPPPESKQADRGDAIDALFRSETARRYIEAMLPEGVSIDRVAATVRLAIANDKTDKLKECTGKSIVMGAAKILQWQLELGHTAYLVPFKDNKRNVMEAVPVASYHGLAELMVNSGAVKHVRTKTVFASDRFEYRLGTNATLDHWPSNKKKDERGEITHFYCILELPHLKSVFSVMTYEEVEEIRQKFSKQWKDGPMKPWYGEKTAVRQAAKLVPKSQNPRLAKALAVMEQEEKIEADGLPDGPMVEMLGAGDIDEIRILREDRELVETEQRTNDPKRPPY